MLILTLVVVFLWLVGLIPALVVLIEVFFALAVVILVFDAVGH